MNDSDLKPLCAKLQRLLQHELDRGNLVVAVDTGWSKVTLAVRLADPLDMANLRNASEDDPDLELWESRDIKHPKEAGVLCKSARQTLSGKIND